MASQGQERFTAQEKETLHQFFRSYKLTASQVAVITALLFNAVFVKSVLVDREQTVVILLEGSLNDTSTNKLLNEIRNMNVGELMDFIEPKRP